MIDLHSISQDNAALAARMRAKLRVRGQGLPVILSRSKRRLPKRVVRAVRTLMAAETQAENPRLRIRMDSEPLAKARKDIEAYLEGIDPADERKGRILGILASLAVNFILLFAVLLVVLRWRGIL